MKSTPILFSGPMVRAIREGRKMQTRRAVNLDKWWSQKWAENFVFCKDPSTYMVTEWGLTPDEPHNQSLNVPYRHLEDPEIPWNECGMEGIECPFGQPGDQLWVKETFVCENPAYVAGYKAEPWRGSPDPDTARILFAADPVHQNIGIRWRPSIFLPRWASRINLEVTAVRVERLQDISEADAIAEGVTIHMDAEITAATVPGIKGPAYLEYFDLWQTINGPGSWDQNPWVWVVEFQQIPSPNQA